MKETKLQNMIETEISKAGWIPLRQQSGLFYTKNGFRVKIGITGIPDLQILKDNGKCFWIEVKTENGKLRIEQETFHEVLRSYGHRVYVIRSLDELERTILKEKKL